jgi:hypothetical protein
VTKIISGDCQYCNLIEVADFYNSIWVNGKEWRNQINLELKDKGKREIPFYNL